MSTPEIQRTAENGNLTERIWPVGVHIPVWLDNDCPSCGDAPCGPHPDTLGCKECEDEWPCNIAANAAEELDRMAEFIGGNPGHVLRWRASALRGVIPGLAPSSEDTPADTPAPHVHTADCMCEMYDLDVVGARECTHCGGHTGGPCGSRCAVAHNEIVKGATPAPRVWREGDNASWNGYHVKVVAAPPNVAIAITPRGDVISADPDALLDLAGGEA